ncbi:NADPH-dependent FMN reductase [Methylobacterium pseudosasicola]|nr:NADPH-dependent FMN reductase [Methylobacterium pseudosasicola]
MRLLALSGSTRRASTNTALLRALQAVAPTRMRIDVYDRVGSLPVFSPDLEGPLTPVAVQDFMQSVHACDGMILSSPEYVRSIPGGLKNAIDWLVATHHVIDKPIALVHASQRGDDMLQVMRTVLATISTNFNPEIFFRLSLLNETPDGIAQIVGAPPTRSAAVTFLETFATFCRERAPCKPA